LEDVNHLLLSTLGNYTSITLPFATAASTALLAPVTERVTFAAPKAGFNERFIEFVAEAANPEAACLGSAHGFACPPNERKFIALLGWTSMQAHEAVAGKESFGKAAGRMIELANEMQMWHVEFKKL
jgi:hypothetical protein